MKTQTNQQNKLTLITILLASTIILSVTPSLSQAQNIPTQNGINYLSYGNAWTEPPGLLQNDFSRFQQDGIKYLSLRIMWSIMMPIPGTVSAVALENIKTVLNIADTFGLKVNLAFWTQFGYNLGFPPWAGTDYYSLLDEPTKTYYLNYLAQTVDQLKTNPAVESWSILNEPYYTDSNQKSQFQNLMTECVQTIKTVDPMHQVTCRFTLSYTPATGKYDSNVYSLFDAFAVTVYLNASNPSDRIYHSTWEDYQKTVQDCKTLGLPLWIMEFGSKTLDPEATKAMFQVNLAKFSADGIARAYAWAWQTRNAGNEIFNIYDGNNPKPAYYALTQTGALDSSNSYAQTINSDPIQIFKIATPKSPSIIPASNAKPTTPKETNTDNLSSTQPASEILQAKPAPAVASVVATDYQELNLLCLGITLVCAIVEFRNRKRFFKDSQF